MSEFIYKGIASALKLKADEWLATLQNESGEWLTEEDIAEQISTTIADRVTAATSNSRKTGQSEQDRKVRAVIKKAGFENPDNLPIDEHLAAFVAWKDEQIVPPSDGTPPDQMDKETLLKLPIVKTLIVEAQQGAGAKFQALQKQLSEKEAEFDTFKRGVNENKVKSIAKIRFRKALEKGNVVLNVEGMDIDPEERVDAAFDRFWTKHKIGLDAKEENPVMLRDDGTPEADVFGKDIPFDEAAVAVAKPMYGVSAQNPNHSGSGIQPSTNGKAAEYTPKYRYGTIEEYDKKWMTETDPAERREITKSKQHHQSKAAGT